MKKLLIIMIIIIISLLGITHLNASEINISQADNNTSELDNLVSSLNTDDTKQEFFKIPKVQEKLIKGTKYTVHEYAHPTINIEDYSSSRYGDLMYYKVNGQIVFCIQPTSDIGSIATTQSEGGSIFHSYSPSIQMNINLFSAYALDRYNKTGNTDYLYAGQILIWWAINPSKYNLNASTSIKPEIQELYTLWRNYYLKPSFMGTTSSNAPLNTLHWNQSTGRYEAILTDKNKVYNYKVGHTLDGWHGDYKINYQGNNKVLVYTYDHHAVMENSTSVTYYPYKDINNSYYDTGQDLFQGSADPLHFYFKFNIVPAVGKIDLAKDGDIDYTTGVSNFPLSGAVFSIYDSTGKLVATMTTSNGYARSSELVYGTYTVRETYAPEGYLLDPTTYTVNLDTSLKAVDGGRHIINKVSRGGFTLIKTASQNWVDGNYETLLKGAIFEVVGLDNKSFDKIYTTDENGVISDDTLPYGHYRITEIEPPEGFLNAGYTEDFNITTNGEIINLNKGEPIINNVIHGGFALTKNTDEDWTNGNVDVPLAGVQFEVKGIDNKTFDKVYTTNGLGVITDNTLLYGRYKITEISTPMGYINNGYTEEFNITKDGEIINLNKNKPIINKVERGGFSLIKNTDEDWTNGDMNVPLSGVQFEVIGLDNTTFDKKYITNGNGKIADSSLPYGHYRITEILTPTGYINNGYTEDFNITENSQMIELNKGEPVINNTIRGGFSLTKNADINYISESVNSPLKDVQFEVKGIDNEDFDKIYITDQEGEISDNTLPFGHYKITEIFTPTGYINNGYTEEFNITENGQIIEINKGEPVINNVIKGRAILSKGTLYEDKKTPLPNVTFNIYKDSNDNGKFDLSEYNKDNIKDIITTDKNGVAETNDLAYSGYFAVEVNAPNYVIIDPTPHYFEIRENEKVVEINDGKTIINKIRNGYIWLVKTAPNFDSNSDYMYPHQGDTFTIYKDLNKNGFIDGRERNLVVDTITTNENGFASSIPLPYGHYNVKETGTTEGYLLNKNTYPIIVDSEINRVNDGKPVENQIFKAPIKIIKSDNFGNKLVDSKFEIYSQDPTSGSFDIQKDLVDTVTTNINGVATSRPLKYGTYYIKEVRSSYDHYLDDSIHSITINQDTAIDNVVTYEFTNTTYQPTINIIKKNEEGITLAGATFNFYIDTNKNTKLDAEDELITTRSTDKDGKISFTFTDKYPVINNEGHSQLYFIEEIKAPEGYLKLKDYLTVGFGVKDTNNDKIVDELYINTNENKIFHPLYKDSTKELILDYDIVNKAPKIVVTGVKENWDVILVLMLIISILGLYKVIFIKNKNVGRKYER